MITARSLLLAATLAGFDVARGAEPEIVFSGILTSEGKTYVALTNPAAKSTRWVQAGDEFSGYSVVRYDPKDDAVFLKKGGAEVRVPLALPKTNEAPGVAAAIAPTGTALPDSSGIAAAVRANLRQLATAAQQLRAKGGVTSVSYNDLVGPGKLIPQLNPVAGESYSTLNFGPDVTAVSVTTTDGATISLQLQPPAGPGAASPADAAGTAPSTLPATPPIRNPRTDPAASNTPAATGGQPTPVAGQQNAASTPPPPPSNAQTPPADEALPTTGRQPPSPSYTIQGGDTLQSIATANGVTVQQLQQLNPTLHGSSLQPGETIRIR